MTTCIQYSRPASSQSEGEVFGLDVAVNNLLTAYFTHGTQKPFLCRPSDIESFDHFKLLSGAAGHDPEASCIGLDPRHPQHNLEKIGCLFRPDPLTSDLIWQRTQVKSPAYATCGLVHTMSGERIAHAVGQLLVAPSNACDALICPSEAIRDAVRALWEIQAEYFYHRFRGKLDCPVQTPVIPLGVNTEKFANITTEDKRTIQRKQLNADDDEIIVLFLGRLSFATKAHPLPLWLALERAAELTQKKLRLVMFGYFKPKDMENHFRDLAKDIAQKAVIEFVMNNDARFPDGLWAGADIFVSPSDNIQESFGLTPVEAMASGLPVIVTDWDGYRGNVRHGVDGFLIPTLGLPPSAGQAIATAYFNEQNYGVSLMGAAQSTSFDIHAFAMAIAKLANDGDLRRRMSANGKERARSVFDWKHIISAYERLWEDLCGKRLQIRDAHPLPLSWPAAQLSYPNPFKMFSGFPSRTLARDDRVTIAMDGLAVATIMKHEMNYFLPELLLSKTQMLEFIDVIRKAGTPSTEDILGSFPATENDRLLRCLGWMIKHGVATVSR